MYVLNEAPRDHMTFLPHTAGTPLHHCLPTSVRRAPPAGVQAGAAQVVLSRRLAPIHRRRSVGDHRPGRLQREAARQIGVPRTSSAILLVERNLPAANREQMSTACGCFLKFTKSPKSYIDRWLVGVGSGWSSSRFEKININC